MEVIAADMDGVDTLGFFLLVEAANADDTIAACCGTCLLAFATPDPLLRLLVSLPALLANNEELDEVG